MHKFILLFFCTLISLLAGTGLAVAQEQEAWSYEQITFPDGETEEHFVYYDPFKEWLYFESEGGEVRYFLAEDVVSFEYRGSRYYSLPFKNGNLSFFKVEYEGESTALLSKANSVNLIQYIANSYDKLYSVCYEADGIKGIHLCMVDFSSNSNRISISSPGSYRNVLEKEVKPVRINNSLFVVGDKGLELIQLDVSRKILLNLFTKEECYNFESLSEFFGQETYRKMKTYARKNKLQEDKLEDLIAMFRYCDTM